MYDDARELKTPRHHDECQWQQQWRCQHKQIKDSRRRKDKLLQDNSSGLVASRCERGESGTR